MAVRGDRQKENNHARPDLSEGSGSRGHGTKATGMGRGPNKFPSQAPLIQRVQEKSLEGPIRGGHGHLDFREASGGRGQGQGSRNQEQH